jgi:hypothetical protein
VRADWESGSVTYDVGADLLAGDLVVDDHFEGVRWGMSWRLKATMWKAESSGSARDEVGPDQIRLACRVSQQTATGDWRSRGVSVFREGPRSCDFGKQKIRRRMKKEYGVLPRVY